MPYFSRVKRSGAPCSDSSSRISIVMLHLYGTREDTKMWAKINFRACKEVQQDGGFRRIGEVGGTKKGAL